MRGRVFGAALVLAGLVGRLGRTTGLPTIPFFILAGIAVGPHTPGVVLVEDPDEIYLASRRLARAEDPGSTGCVRLRKTQCSSQVFRPRFLDRGF